MKHVLLKALLLTGFLLAMSGGAQAAEQTVVLKVDMWCPSCPYIIKRSLMDVDGVEEVAISYRKQIAVVRFDDSRTTVPALTQATADMGFPSSVVSPDGN